MGEDPSNQFVTSVTCRRPHRARFLARLSSPRPPTVGGENSRPKVQNVRADSSVGFYGAAGARGATVGVPPASTANVPSSSVYCTVKATNSAMFSSSNAATTMCCWPSAMYVIGNPVVGPPGS